MSERTVSENNKLWEAAEKMAEKAVANAKAENEEERRKQKKRLTKIILMMVLIALIMIFASIAWFAMNKAVTADTMAIEANGSSFDIATKKEKVSYKDRLLEVDSEYNEGTKHTYNNEDGGESDYYIPTTSKLILRCDANSKGEGDKDILPGGYGELDLYMIAKKAGTLNARINVKVTGFTALEFPVVDEETGEQKTDAQGNKLYVTELKKTSELTTEKVRGSQLEGKDLNVYKQAEKYLCGHILFFKDEGDTSSGTPEKNRYYYKTPAAFNTADMSWTLEFGKENAAENTAYKVPVRWMWTNTLGQMALPNNADDKRKGYPVVKDGSADHDTVVKYLKDNKENIFKPYTEAGSTITVDNEMIDNPTDGDNFRKLSDGYNYADFDIGTCVNYFMIEVSVEKK